MGVRPYKISTIVDMYYVGDAWINGVRPCEISTIVDVIFALDLQVQGVRPCEISTIVDSQLAILSHGRVLDHAKFLLL